MTITSRDAGNSDLHLKVSCDLWPSSGWYRGLAQQQHGQCLLPACSAGLKLNCGADHAYAVAVAVAQQLRGDSPIRRAQALQ